MENNENKQSKKNIKKWIILAAILLILIAIGTMTTMYIINSDISYEIEEITQFNFFKLYENKKYGVIDRSGNIIIEPTYDAINIPNPSKGLFICYYDYNEENDIYKTKVLNDKNEQIYTQYEEILPFIFKESTSEVPFEKSVLQYKENGKYGLIGFDGKKITQAKYDSIESLLYKEGCLLVKENEKYGLINIKGKQVIKTQYDTITADGYYDEQTKYKQTGFIVGNKTTNGYRYGYIDSKGKEVLEVRYNQIERITEINNTQDIYLLEYQNGKVGVFKNKQCIIKNDYEDIEYNYTNELFLVTKNSKQGVMNLEGKYVLELEYDSILFSGRNINTKKDDKIIIYNKNGEEQNNEEYTDIISTENENYFVTINKEEKFGVINKEGTVIIKNDYQYIEYAFDNYFIATKDNKVGLLTDKEEEKIAISYNVIQKIQNNNILQAIDASRNMMEIYNNEIIKTIEMKNASLSIEYDYIRIMSDKEMKYIDEKGNEISNIEIFKNNVLFASNSNGKWGFVDKQKNVIIESKYDMVTEFNKYGYAGIKQNDKWGVVDIQGKIIVEPTYKIDWQDPEFINKYCKLNFGYGFEYYTDEL